MAYTEQGTLTTDKRETAISETWDTQTEWEAYQSISNIEITNGVLTLSEVSVPDEEDLQAWYDFSQYDSGDTTGFSDLSGNGHDLVNGSITDVTASINGVQAGNFDGVDDTVYSNTFTSVSSPYTGAIVAEIGTPNDLNNLISLNSGDEMLLFYDARSGEENLVLRGDQSISGGSETDTLITFHVDGANSFIRANGTEVATGDTVERAIDIIALGSREIVASDRYFPGAIGEYVQYPIDKSAIVGDIETYLADKWGITL